MVIRARKFTGHASFRSSIGAAMALSAPAVRPLFLSTAVIVLAACAAGDNRPYPPFDRLEIVSAGARADTSPAQSTGEMVTKGAAVSAATGAAAGMTLSLICGPFFAECASQLVPLFMVSESGLLVDTLTGLSREQADQVNACFESLTSRRDLNQDLTAAVSSLIAGERLVVTGGDARLITGLAEIRAFQGIKSTFRLRLTAAAELTWNLGSQEPESTQRRFECDTETLAVEDWLADNGRRLDDAIRLCVDALASQITIGLISPV